MSVRIIVDNTPTTPHEVSRAAQGRACKEHFDHLPAETVSTHGPAKHSARLGQKMASALGNPEKETWIWDTEVKGFFLRVYPSGQKTFPLKYRVDGQQKVYTIGKFGSPWTVEQARDRASALLYEAQTGADPQTRKKQLRHSHTVAGLVAIYLKDGPKDKPNKRNRSWDNDTLHLNRHVIPLLGAKKAHAVTPADVADLQTAVAQGKTATTLKTKKRGVARARGGTRAAAVTLVCPQAMYNWAIKRKLVPENPCKGVARFASDPKERYPGSDEIKSLLCALTKLQDEGELPANLASAFRVLLLTGARKSEISDLRWEEIDFERGFITLSALRSKTGKKRILHRRIRKVEPVLEKTDPQHPLKTNRRPPFARLGIEWLDQPTQAGPRHDLVHLLQKRGLARLLRVKIKTSDRESRLPHQSNPVQNGSTMDCFARLGNPRTYSEVP